MLNINRSNVFGKFVVIEILSKVQGMYCISSCISHVYICSVYEVCMIRSVYDVTNGSTNLISLADKAVGNWHWL